MTKLFLFFFRALARDIQEEGSNYDQLIYLVWIQMSGWDIKLNEVRRFIGEQRFQLLLRLENRANVHKEILEEVICVASHPYHVCIGINLYNFFLDDGDVLPEALGLES